MSDIHPMRFVTVNGAIYFRAEDVADYVRGLGLDEAARSLSSPVLTRGAKTELKEDGCSLVRYKVRIEGKWELRATFPELALIFTSLTPADKDTIRLLAPSESFKHEDWTITREENR
jgi:hypothetical protein